LIADPLINSINFPAGILQSPAFDVNFDAAANFGAIGAVMGHELTHGFDDQGRQYDGTGKLTNWWTNASLENFQERSECMIEQYSKFQILGVQINGNRTLSENIADNGGVKMAFRAYENHLHPNSTRARAIRRRRSRMLPEFTNEQLFFLAYGQLWCEKATDDFWRLRAAADVHAPAKFRVWGPLQNFADFAEAFQCPIGSNMNPASKCQLW
jgi:endothelin-converting enzyme